MGETPESGNFSVVKGVRERPSLLLAVSKLGVGSETVIESPWKASKRLRSLHLAFLAQAASGGFSNHLGSVYNCSRSFTASIQLG